MRQVSSSIALIVSASLLVSGCASPFYMGQQPSTLHRPVGPRIPGEQFADIKTVAVVPAAMKPTLDKGYPLVLVSDGDVGGLIGMHLIEEVGLKSPVVSIDGIDLREFDYIDIGEILPSSGSVPVVIKSLVFPASAQAG